VYNLTIIYNSLGLQNQVKSHYLKKHMRQYILNRTEPHLHR